MKLPSDGEIKIHVKVMGPDGATIELGHVSGKTTTEKREYCTTNASKDS